MHLPHTPRWAETERTGHVVVERCTRTRIRLDPPADPADAHEHLTALITAAITARWPGLPPRTAHALARNALAAGGPPPAPTA